jgi:hypothetical protein
LQAGARGINRRGKAGASGTENHCIANIAHSLFPFPIVPFAFRRGRNQWSVVSDQ